MEENIQAIGVMVWWGKGIYNGRQGTGDDCKSVVAAHCEKISKDGKNSKAGGNFLSGLTSLNPQLSTLNLLVVRSRFVAMARMTLCASRWVQTRRSFLARLAAAGPVPCSSTKFLFSIDRAGWG